MIPTIPAADAGVDGEDLLAMLSEVVIEDHVRQISEPAAGAMMDESLLTFAAMATSYWCCATCVPCTFGGVVQLCCDDCVASSAAASCGGWKIVVQTPSTGSSGAPCEDGFYQHKGTYNGNKVLACLRHASI